MAREIETKCIHLEEEENSINHYGAISYPIYQSATYAHPGVGQSTGYDTAACRIQRENIWRRQLLLWKMESMHWHFHQEWQRSH